MAPPVLFRVLYSTPTPTAQQVWRLESYPALLPGYQRHKVRYADYPAIRHAPSTCSVRGTIVSGLSERDMKRLDTFEGSEYIRVKVTCRKLEKKEDVKGGEEEEHPYGNLGGMVLGENVEAEVYVWVGGRDNLEEGEWDFQHFVKEKMSRWVGGKREEWDEGMRGMFIRLNLEDVFLE